MIPEILIVDTDRSSLATMAVALKAAGYAPTLAADFSDAAALLKSHRFAVVVTAHRLDAHNGLHLVLRARAEAPSVGAIISTATSDPVLESEASAFGAQCVVAPWDHPQQLLAAVARAATVQPS